MTNPVVFKGLLDGIGIATFIYTMKKDYSILTVDDDEALVNLLANELTSEGFEVTTAYDGDEAIEALKVKLVDLILLDVNMPRMNGFEVLKYVKKNFPAIKVIMLTAYNDVGNAMRSKRLGADDFIGKPYDVVELLVAMDRLFTN
jgi:DNA-binding response OmpR family regulator